MERPKTSFNFSGDDSFVFKQRSGQINWREIQSIDLDDLIQKGDISKINEILENLTYANIDKSDLERFPDTFFLKLFRLSQFALEYLQQKDHQQTEEHKETIQEKTIIQQSAKQLEEQLQIHKKVTQQLSREMTHKKKTLSTYEYLLKQPATMAYMNRAIDRDKAVKCPKCSKFFQNFEFFQKHKERRHPDPRPSTAPVSTIETIKSTLEEQLKAIQETQEKEILQFKTMLKEQLADIKQAKSQNFEIQIPEKASAALPGQIEDYRKELMEFRYKKQMQEELLRRKEQEIYRMEQENLQLVKAKEKLERKMLMTRSSGRSRGTKNSKKEENYYTQDDFHSKNRSKIRSESGESNLITVMKELVDDKSEVFRIERKKDSEAFKREAFTPYSERMSPSFKGSEFPETYIYPLNSPKAHDIIEAAKVLGIDPVKETQYLYLATEFLKTPIPKAWVVTQLKDQVAFRNKETGEIKENHPGIEYFQEVYRQKKNRKYITFDKIQAIVKLPDKKYITKRYPGGITLFFIPDENVFMTQKTMLKERVQTALDKMKTISISQLIKMDEEMQKLSEKGYEYRKANETINSELLTIFNKLKR